jgi:predicted transposase YbfD/YdcC
MLEASSFFRDIPDPRASNARHSLCDIILIALAATLCGAQSCVEYAQFGRSKQALLERVIGPFDPPSHDTFSRVLRSLDPAAFSDAFARFTAAFGQLIEGVVAIDGKAMRRAYETGCCAAPPLMVTAWAQDARLALAGIMPHKTGSAHGDKITNEVEAAIAVVGLLDLDRCVVTADALHCHRRMAEAIIERGGDYALTVKGNQPRLQKAAQDCLAKAAPEASTAQTSELSHGRREVRQALIVEAPGLAEELAFKGLSAIARITTRRDDSEPHVRLYFLSKSVTANEALAITRAHWSVENALHWSLDVTMAEDQARSRKDNAPANLALINRMALNLLNQIDDPKTSKRGRIKRCAWEDDYLLNALCHMR